MVAAFPFKSIMDEIESKGISPGESIILGRGIYREPYLEILIGVSLIGEDLGSVIISGYQNNPSDKVITVYSQSAIKNLVICNGGAGICMLDKEKPLRDIIIENNLIINNENGIFFADKKDQKTLKLSATPL